MKDLSRSRILKYAFNIFCTRDQCHFIPKAVAIDIPGGRRSLVKNKF